MRSARRGKWLQFHLSTAVVLSIAAGVLVMWNCSPQLYEVNGIKWGKMYGWPWPAYYQVNFNINISDPDRGMTADRLAEIMDFLCSNIVRPSVRTWMLAADVAVCLGMLFFICVLCEKFSLARSSKDQSTGPWHPRSRSI
jgi:hypothetical protein